MKTRVKLVAIALTIAMLFGFVPTASADCGGTIHVVQRGENLFRIALRYGITVEAIKVASNHWSNIIRVGQRLCIPGTRPAPTSTGTSTTEATPMTAMTTSGKAGTSCGSDCIWSAVCAKRQGRSGGTICVQSGSCTACGGTPTPEGQTDWRKHAPADIVPMIPVPWISGTMPEGCAQLFGFALTVLIHLTGPRHVWGECFAVYDPSVVLWPDHILRYLQDRGYTPQSLIEALNRCLGKAKLSHEMYQWEWPNEFKPKGPNDWSDKKGQKGYDGSRWWELKRAVIIPAADELSRMKQRLELQENAWIFNVAAAGAVVTVGLAIVVGPELLIMIPVWLNQIPENLVVQALNQAPAWMP